MKKIEQMRANLEKLKVVAQTMLDENKIEEAKAKMQEVKDLKAAIEIQEALDKEEEEALKIEHAEIKAVAEDRSRENANIIRAMIKKIGGGSLTDAENALLIPATGTGTNGEGYILPQDVSTLIRKKIREYKSFRDVVGYMPTSALTGSFPIEDFETLTGLVDFTDGDDGVDETDIKFKNVSFALKEKAAFIKLSNTLISLTDNNLIEYIAECFAKKAVITENAMAITTLKANKTVKALADYKELKKSLNKDLDPAVLLGTVIVTNQTGFDYLDQIEVEGKPLLQPIIADSSKKTFKGYEVVVFSDALLPSTAATATKGEQTPFIYGNLKEAVKFVDLQGQIGFATSKEAGFMSNTTIARLIEFVDVVQVDKSDKCYVYATVETAPKTGA